MLEDMLRGCVMEFTGSWDRYIPLIEFAYNNSYQSSIGMAPYEALYDRRCRTPVCWIELNEHKVIGLEFRHCKRYRSKSSGYSAKVKGYQ